MARATTFQRQSRWWFVRCLFCGGPGARTDEHVLQQFWGAELVLRDDVCGTCNTQVFSALDGDLADFARSIVFHDHPEMTVKRPLLLGSLLEHFDETTGFWETLRVTKDGPRVLAQLIFKSLEEKQVSVAICVDQKDAGLEDRMAEELAEPSLLRVEEAIVSGLDPPMTPSLVRSAPRKWVIRAPDHESAAHVRKLLDSGVLGKVRRTDEPLTRRSTENPKARSGFGLPLGNIERAIAKSAVNFLCFVLGPHVARQEAGMMDLARFAWDPNPGLRPIEEHPVSLFTFASLEDWVRDSIDGLALDGHHTLLLAPARGTAFHVVTFILYGRPFAAVNVRLSRPSAAAIFFDYRQKRHRLSTPASDPRWFAEHVGVVARPARPPPRWPGQGQWFTVGVPR